MPQMIKRLPFMKSAPTVAVLRLGGVIAGSILLFPIGLLFLLLQGGDVTLESGSGLTATVIE